MKVRFGFTVETDNEDEEIEFSTVENSDKVRVNTTDQDGDCTEVNLSIRQAKQLRDALDKCIAKADNPYRITADYITTNYIRDYYFGAAVPRYSFGRYGL